MVLPKEFSSGAVIFNQKGERIEYLLIYSGRNHVWGFPKGHGEPGEDEKTTALREIEEETGLTDLQFLREARFEISYPAISKRGNLKGKRIEKHAVYFVCRSNSREVRVDNDEITAYRWVSRDEALAQLPFDGLKDVLRQADAAIKKSRNKADSWTK